MNGGVVVILLVALGINIWCSVICYQKGKPWMIVMGWLLSGIILYCGAIRIAKPNSQWARDKYQYDPMKLELAKMRFPKERWMMENAQWLAQQQSV